ncbi:MAG: hypothetical protein ABSF86_07410, partial [Steroidobacteraceae bacterium]
MAQPVLVKQSFLIALMTGAQAVMPAVVAVICLYWSVGLYRMRFDTISAIVAVVLCLVLIRAPRDVSTQLTSQRTVAMADVLVHWVLLLVALVAIGLLTTTLDAYPRRVYVIWAVVTPAALLMTTYGMHEIMRRFLMTAFDNRKAIFAGYNNSSQDLANRLKENPGMRIQVAGFFDDRSVDRLAMQSDNRLIGNLSDVAKFVNEQGVDIIFIALPIRHLQRVMNLLDDLRDTTASIYYVPDIFVFDLIQARSGDIHGIPVVAMCETPFYGYRGVTKRVTDVVFSAGILLLTLPLFVLIAV